MQWIVLFPIGISKVKEEGGKKKETNSIEACYMAVHGFTEFNPHNGPLSTVLLSPLTDEETKNEKS